MTFTRNDVMREVLSFVLYWYKKNMTVYHAMSNVKFFFLMKFVDFSLYWCTNISDSFRFNAVYVDVKYNKMLKKWRGSIVSHDTIFIIKIQVHNVFDIHVFQILSIEFFFLSKNKH